MQGIYVWLKLCTGDLPVLTVGGKSRWFLALWNRVPITLYLDGNVW